MTSSARRLLVGASLLNLMGHAIHSTDHFRLGIGLTPLAVLLSGVAASAVAVMMLVLARAGHRHAPLLAIASGFPAALAFAAVHLPPSWGAFSQHYGAGTDAVSWLCLAIAVACSIALGVAGALTLNRQGVATRSPPLVSS